MGKTFSWTKEQEQAFSDRNKSLLVSASAGSGKTTVMIQRIVDLMLGVKAEKTPITNFLIVTFTKASATDMKEKLVSRLLEIENADDYVLEQIENVAVADISDLHSFYSKLISTYFYEVNIDPSYKIVDGDESENLKEKAISKLFEAKEKQGDVAYFRLYDIYQKKRQNAALKDVIYKFNDFLNSINDGEKWFKQKLEESYEPNLESNVCAKLINDYVTSRIKEDAEECEAFAQKCADIGCLTYYDYFSEMASLLKTVNKHNSYLVNARNLFEINYPRAKRLPEEFEFLRDDAETLKTKTKDKVTNYKDNFVSCDENVLIDGLVEIKQNLQDLFALVQEFNEIYSKFKKDVNGLDFNDLEKYALKILENDAICKAVQEKYKYIFVDEYQDINEVQEKIISMISGKTNRFMVGDIKQSIYRFRHCDPEIFTSKCKEFSEVQDYARLIKLNANFRSDKKILKFVDEVFSGVMTENFGGVDYAKDSTFVAGESNADAPLSVNLCYIDTTKEKREKQNATGVYSVKNHVQEIEEEAEKSVAEANFVAKKIAELTSSLSEKPLKYGEIAILVQSRNDNTIRFLDTLRSYGIPIASDEKYDLMTRNYVQEILNFISYVCSSQDDILLFKVLKSKLFGFSDSELVSLRKLNMKVRFYETIDYAGEIEDEKLKQKVVDFKSSVEKFKKLAGLRTLKEMARLVVQEFELDKINLFVPDGEKINNEIDKFISRLPEKTAYEFLANYPNFSVVYENECAGNAVNVMTIHKSKGIEFKAVFIINTSKQFNLRTTTEMVVFNKRFGAGADYYDTETRTKKSSIPLSAIRIYETKKLVEEQQRLLYVALTRAKEKLFVICSKQKKSLSSEFPKHPMSFAHWFERFIVKELDGKHNELINFENFEIANLLDVPKFEEKQVLLVEQKVDDLIENNYAFNSSVKIPLKNSISKILKMSKDEEDENDKYEDYKFSEESVSAAERGTIYHKFFQMIDLKNLENLDDAIELAKQKMLKEELDVVNLKMIKDVLSLDLFKQIQKDDVVLKEREFYAKVSAKLYGENANENDEFIMQGVIDLLIIRGNDAILLDYKTGKLNDKKLEDYTYQLNVYADVAERAYKVRVSKKYLCFIDSQKIIEI